MRLDDQEPWEESCGRSILAGVLPMKFTYRGPGAATHLRYARTQNYSRPLRLSGATKVALLGNLRDAQTLVDWGAGDGQQALKLLTTVHAETKSSLGYVGIDFSPELLSYAVERIAQAPAIQSAVSVHHDLESKPLPDLAAACRRPVLSLVLGNLLGNVGCAPSSLRNIRCSLPPSSVLVVSVAACRSQYSEDYYLRPYRSSSFNQAVWALPSFFGFSQENSRFELRFTSGHKVAIVGTHTVEKDFGLRNAGRFTGVQLSRNHAVRTFFSRRFTVDELATVAKEAGIVEDLKILVADDSSIVGTVSA